MESQRNKKDGDVDAKPYKDKKITKYIINVGGYVIFCYENLTTNKELSEDVTVRISGLEILLPGKNGKKWKISV